MQSFTDHQGETSLLCSECGTQFNSASLLLKHFANHISYSKKKNVCQTENSVKNFNFTPNSAVAFTSDEEKKAESILERVLQQTILNNSQMFDLGAYESNMRDSSSSTSEYCTSTSSDNEVCLTERSLQIPQTVIDMEKEKIKADFPSSTDINLVKCDLQKRLENCILKLSSKRDSKLENNTESLKMQRVKAETRRNESTKNHNDAEDFNPLKFCIVTMEEGEDKLDLGATKTQSETREENIDLANYTRSPSSRKQQSPKKIQHLNEKAEVMMEALKIGVNERNAAPFQSKKKYPCHVCWKVFGWSTDLKRHILTHTGERPFKCQQCAATFTRNFLLQKHEAKIHPLPIQVSRVTPTTDHKVGANEVRKLPTCGRVSSEESPTKRKRVVVQQAWNKKQMICKFGKKLQKLQDCHSIPYSLLSQKALNIS